MLIFPRNVGEGVVIGDEIIITVVEIRDDKVQLSIERPAEVPGDIVKGCLREIDIGGVLCVDTD